MKTKKFDKKLSLNKETIAHLKVEEMGKVPGGFGITAKCKISEEWTCNCVITEFYTCECTLSWCD